MSLSREFMNKSVRRNNKYKDVVDLLVYGGLEGGQNSDKKSFTDIKDLIIFSAMVGKKFETKEDVDPKDNQGITLGTFGGSGSARGSRVDQHNVIFMFSLLSHKSMDYIRDDKISEVIELFEKYSNGGLKIINGWLVESGWNSLCLLDKMLDELAESSPALQVTDNPF